MVFQNNILLRNRRRNYGGGYLQDNKYGGKIKQSHNHSSANSDSLYKLEIDSVKWELYSKTGYIIKNKPSTIMGLQLSYLNHNQNNKYGFTTYKSLQ